MYRSPSTLSTVSRPTVCLAALFAALWVAICGPAAAQSVATLPTVENPAVGARALPLSSGERAQFEQAIRNKQWSEAEKLLAEAYERHPDSAELLKTLAKISFQNENYWNAAIAYKKAEKIEPLDEQSRFSLAMAYIVLDHRDWAEPELRSLAEASPGNPLYLYWLARLDYDNQLFPDAIAKLKRVIAIDASFLRAYDNLGLSLEGAGRRDEALQAFEKAIELNQAQQLPSPWPSLNLGTMLYRLGRTDEAEKHLREAVRIDPDLAQAQYQLGSLLEARGALEQGLAHLSRAAELDPSDPKPHYALGRLYRRTGDDERARAALRRFSELEKKRKEKKGPR
jgi:tetratricopeptide (TPR) repeat protein